MACEDRHGFKEKHDPQPSRRTAEILGGLQVLPGGNRIAPDRSRYYVHRVKVFIDLHGLNRPGLTVKSPADL